MNKKDYQFGMLTLFMLAVLSVSFSSCGKDGDSSGSAPYSGGEGEKVERMSPLIGTWKNTVSSDMEYCIEFYEDGTGVYIKEGTTENNFKDFYKSYFKFSTIAYEDKTTQNSLDILNSGNKTGSVEISFDDPLRGSSTGTYVVTSDGKLQLELLENIEKSIFYKSNEALPTSINIDGLWKYEDEVENKNFVLMMRFNESKSGYLACNNLYYTGVVTDNFSPLIEFSSYEVIGDIITLKDVKQNNSEYYKFSSDIRIKIISQNNILINIGGKIQYSMTKAVPQTINSNTIVGSWIASGVGDYNSLTYFLRFLPNNEMVYYKLEKSFETYTCREKRGSYSIYDNSFIVFADKDMWGDNVEYYNIFPSNISASSMVMTLPNEGTKYNLNRVAENRNVSKLYGTWRSIRNGISETITFNSDGQFIADMGIGDVVKGDYCVYDSNSFYLFGPELSGNYDFQIESDGSLVIDGKHYYVKIHGDESVSGELGTENNPFSVHDAVVKCKETGETPTTETYYVKGIVGETCFISSYKNATIYMVDHNESSEVFTAYRVKGVGNKDLREGYEIPVGSTVIVSGKLVNYKNKTPETAVGTGTLISVDGKAPDFSE